MKKHFRVIFETKSLDELEKFCKKEFVQKDYSSHLLPTFTKEITYFREYCFAYSKDTFLLGDLDCEIGFDANHIYARFDNYAIIQEENNAPQIVLNCYISKPQNNELLAQRCLSLSTTIDYLSDTQRFLLPYQNSN